MTHRLMTAVVVLLSAASRLTAQDHSGQYPAADVAAGSRIYYANCAQCHGATGTSVGGIDLRRGRLPRASTDEALAGLVARGIPGTGMPPFRFTPDEMRGLIAFVRAGLGVDPDRAAREARERGAWPRDLRRRGPVPELPSRRASRQPLGRRTSPTSARRVSRPRSCARSSIRPAACARSIVRFAP